MSEYICYIPKKFTVEHQKIIGTANAIIEEYGTLGYSLTVRSLYYKFVGRGLIENTIKSYQRFTSIINDARLAGLVSWSAIEDNLRVLQGNPTVSGPKEAIVNARESFKLDLWASQEWRPEVQVEKDAAVGTIEGICSRLRVNFMACRGYMSQSAQWRTGQRMASYIQKGQRPIIFHFGDHDPSGIDMTRDNRERIEMFAGVPVMVVRLALNMNQVEQYNLPPNPAKVTDSRFEGYKAKFGEESWELDALDPQDVEKLIEENVLRLRNADAWDKALAQEAADLDALDNIIEDMA